MTKRVMEIITPMLIEKNILESRVHEYSTQGKTPYYIRQKLLQKKFDAHILAEVMAEFGNIFDDAETYRKTIQDHIKKYERKGFSRKKIFYELQWQYRNAGSVIDEEMATYSDISILQTLLPKLLRLYSIEKVTQKCLQIGFSLSDIRKTITESTT